jgi:hypothetical protein
MIRYLQRNTPPKATSSPKSKTRGSVRSACERAELMAWKRFKRVAVPFFASEDSSLLANADLELWFSSEVASKSVGVFSRALGGRVECRRDLWQPMVKPQPGRIIVLVAIFGWNDRDGEHYCHQGRYTRLPARL